MLHFFVRIDHWLFFVINNGMSFRPIDALFEEISSLGAWPVGLVAVGLLAGSGGKILRKHILILIVAFAVAAPLNNLIKKTVGRNRPMRAFQEQIDEGTVTVNVLERRHPKRMSFPSGHSLTAFLFMTYVAIVRRPYRYWTLGLAFLIAFSRVYVGVHFPLDCVAGSLIGAGGAWAAWLAFQRLEAGGVKEA